MASAQLLFFPRFLEFSEYTPWFKASEVLLFLPAEADRFSVILSRPSVRLSVCPSHYLYWFAASAGGTCVRRNTPIIVKLVLFTTM